MDAKSATLAIAPDNTLRVMFISFSSQEKSFACPDCRPRTLLVRNQIQNGYRVSRYWLEVNAQPICGDLPKGTAPLAGSTPLIAQEPVGLHDLTTQIAKN
jgi:hypothetical protein